MKSTKKFLLTIAYIILSSLLFAQTNTNDLSIKYKNYRSNLVNNYILKIGISNGNSLPASERQISNHKIKWADATISLGHYLGVLATEYHLLSLKGENTDNTTKELYYAISALYRLDYKAETFYSKGDSLAQLNGFFVRDDINNITVAEYKKLNSNTQIQKVNNFNSDLTDIDSDVGYSLNNEMSKDQVIFLLMGLKLIDKYIPEDLVYKSESETAIINYSSGITSLNLAAEYITILILEYLSSNKSIIGWPIINSVTNKRVKRGYNAFHFQAKAYNNIYEEYTNGGNIYGRCNRLFASLENGLLRAVISPVIKQNQGHMVLTLAAISNQFNNKTQAKLFKYSFKDYKNGGNYEWEPLLHAALYSQKTDLLDGKANWYKDFLSQAPANGPYNYKDSNLEHQNWSVSRRTTQPESRGDRYNNDAANFNGLDYMLIYNLYLIYYDKKKVQ